MLSEVKCSPLPPERYAEWRAQFAANLADNFGVIARAWKRRSPPRPGVTWSSGSLRLRIPEFPELNYWFPPQVIAALAAIAEAAHRCQEPHFERVALISLSASIIAKWPHTLSYAMDIDHTRPHRRVQRFTLDRVLTTYLKRLDRTLACLGMLHQAYRDAGVLDTLHNRCRVIYPHDARQPMLVVPAESQALVIPSPPYFNAVDYPRAHRMSLCWMNGYAPTALASRRHYIGLHHAGGFDLDAWLQIHPTMTLLQLIDMAGVFADMAASSRDERGRSKSGEAEDAVRAPEIRSSELRGKERIIRQRAATAQAPGQVVSWRGLLGKLWRVQRLQIFDNPRAPKLDHASLVQPGCVSVIDLSDTDSPAVNNLVIADLLRGIQRQQEENFHKAQAAGKRPTPVVIIVEEAHEFLSAQRIHQMPVLFQQVAKIAKRGRKRWLGLVFVTQLPQHLPDEVLGLINNFILHKIADGTVVERLRKSISGLDRGQWGVLPGLAPGQALVSLTHMTRPLLVSVDPALCKLKLSE
jgi:hypothetical protein